MKELSPGVWQLKGKLPLPNSINTYLVDDVLFDAGAKFDTGPILKQLAGRKLSAHAITHAHPDHQGASKAVKEKFGVPVWIGENDVAKAEDPQLIKEEQPSNTLNNIFFKSMAGPAVTVDRALKEGDDVTGFTVLDTPGHSKGHVSFWRESDGVLILGDVLNNMDIYTGIPGLKQPKKAVTPDPETNRTSIRKLGELDPKLVLFGHGAPLRDTEKFKRFCASV
jgi:glyoxylase-like metal-dependent hydrolase (beta-lactamase superfamily II)